jgi:TP901 family phage tail tape measure protein
VGRTVSIKLMADVANFTRNIGGTAVGAVKTLSGELDKAAKAGKLDAVSDRAMHAGLALTGMAAYAIKSAADFDKAMSAVSAATHAPAAQIDALRAAAIQAGKDTQYSATEAADGITELSKAGVSTADILGGGLKGALALAAAGQLSVGEAAETAASAVTQFRLSGEQVPHVADLLAAGAGKAQGSVHDMGAALNQSGLVAAQFGLSVEDTTGVLAEFASAGLTGSDAGTSLKTMLLALANPSKSTRDLMADLGISFYDAQGKFVGLSGVAQILQTRLKDLTVEQRNQALGQIFGNDAIRSASVLYTDGAAGVEQWKTKVNDAGYATSTAAKLTDNLAGDLERLKGSVETLAIEAGGGANGGLRILVKSLEAIVDQLSQLPSGVGAAITVVGALSGAALLAAAGWVKMRRSTAEMLVELRNVGPAGEKAATGIEKTTKWAGRAAAAFAIMEAGSAAVNAAFGEDLNPQVDALSRSLAQWAASGQKSGEAARLLGDDFSDLKYDLGTLDSGFWAKLGNGTAGFIESISGMGGVMDQSLQHAKERLGAIDQALTQLVQNGQAQQAAQVFSTLAEQAKKSGVSVDELKKGLPGYASSLESTGTAAKGASGKLGDLNSALDMGAGQQDKYKTAAAAAAGAARGERDALGALFSQLKAETDPVFALIDAQHRMADSQKAATKAVRDHGKGSAEAKSAQLDLAKAAIELQGATGNLTANFNGKLTPALRTTLKAAGLTEGQIKGVEKQLDEAKKAADKYTGKYEAKVSAPGATAAKKDIDKAYDSAHGFAGPYRADLSAPNAKSVKKDIDKAYDAAHGFAGPYKANLSVSNSTKVESELRRLSAMQQALKSANTLSLHGHADGGWTGPGSKYEPAGIVHADEFVIRKESRQRIEQTRPGLLDAMNRTGEIPPGYADGGMVWPYRVNVSKTKIPQLDLPSSGGATDDWIVRTVMSHFPALHYISKYRQGARTLTGNVSYHARHRAVDWPANYELARWWHDTYGARTKELITPWNELNIHNGRSHQYTGAVWQQHNFAGGNAHDHIAMANGGVIEEPVFGVGLRSGDTYSFGERGKETVTPGVAAAAGGNTTIINLSPRIAAGANMREAGRQIAEQLQPYLAAGGSIVVRGQTLLGAR